MKKAIRIQCLDRAMDILETIAQRGEAGVSEIARHLNLNVATVHNIASSFATRNYLNNRNGNYSIGPQLAGFAAHWDLTAHLLNVLDRPLLNFTQVTGEAPLVSILVGTKLRVLASVTSQESPFVYRSDKLVTDPLLYGTGHVLVAFSPPEFWHEFISQHLHARGESLQDTSFWTEHLQAIRTNGHAIVERPGEVDSFAAPVTGPGNRVIAAIGISCPSGRMTETAREKILFALKETAAEIRQCLVGGIIKPNSQ